MSFKVSLMQMNPLSSVSLPFGDMPAHSSKQSSAWVYGYAVLPTNGEKDVLTANIANWDADLDHLLKDHSGWGPPEGKIHVEIFEG